MAINGLLASPGFDAWLEGEPLDIQRLYWSSSGKPRVSIFCIAHLNDAERMFFVTLLLNQVLGWMRAQPGTTSLRALVYMDEIFGFFPPVANPPSKLPLLTLLKQARAFGIGLVLATQNPVDLDYKGLANIGTWFLGRLQTDRDKQRVLEGLEGAAAAQATAFDRAAMDQTLAGLGNRLFLLRNVHEEGVAVFESRWALSYLRGPLTRAQIKTIMDARRASFPTPARPSGAPAAARLPAAPAPTPPGSGPIPAPAPGGGSGRVGVTGAAPESGLGSTRPALPPAVLQFFIPARAAAAGALVYHPRLLGAAAVRFVDAKTRVEATQAVVLLAPIKESAVPVDWAEAEEVRVDPNDLERNPAGNVPFAPLPPAAALARNYADWQKELVNTLYGTRKLVLLRSPSSNQVSRVDETEGDFRVRLQQAFREQRDDAVAKLRAKYTPKTTALQERLRRAEQAVERETGQARSAKLSTMLSFGSTLLGAFLGRKAITATNIGKAATAMKGVGRSMEQSQDVARASETVQAVKQQMADLDAQFQAETAALEAGLNPAQETLETLEVRPSKANITVKLVALAWTPCVRDDSGRLSPVI
jgi:hypothetical protein